MTVNMPGPSSFAAPGDFMNRRRDASLCLIAAPIVYLLSQALWPPGSNEGNASQLAAVAAHPTAFAAATICEAVTWILLTVGAIGWSTRLQRLGRQWGFAATVTVFIGMIAFTCAAAVNLTVLPLARVSDRSAAVALKDSWAQEPVFVVIVLMFYIGILGLLLLAVAVWRGGHVGWWLPLLMLTGVIIEEGFGGHDALRAVLTYIPVAVALVVIGLILGREQSAPRNLTGIPEPHPTHSQ